MEFHNPDTSLPGQLAIGETSPVQQVIRLLYDFFAIQPQPDLNEESAKRTGLLAANHLLCLTDACGLLNGSGMHSAAVVMLRSLEDTLDIFCAVTTVPKAAESWEKGNLKASDAARLWIQHRGNPATSAGQSLSDYRKGLRDAFNKYSHASYEICLWNLYFRPKPMQNGEEPLIGTLEINSPRYVINSNGHAIDAHLTAHLLEFFEAIKDSYATDLATFANAKCLSELEAEIHDIMKMHDSHGCQNVQVPAELRKLRQ